MTTLEERVQALEERECYDDTDIKEKMGYNDVPSGSNIQAEIDALEPEYIKSLFEDMLDEAISEETQSVTRTLSFSVLYDGSRTPVQGVSIWLDSADDDTFKGVTGNAGGCTISNVIDEEHRIYFKDDGGWVEPISINGSSTVNKIEVSENQTSFEILLYSPEPETQSVTRTLSFSVKYTDNSPVSSETIHIDGANDTGEHFQGTTDSAGECTMSDVPDEDYLVYLNNVDSQDVVSINGETPVIEDGYFVLTVNESSTSFDIIVKPQQQ